MRVSCVCLFSCCAPATQARIAPPRPSTCCCLRRPSPSLTRFCSSTMAVSRAFTSSSACCWVGAGRQAAAASCAELHKGAGGRAAAVCRRRAAWELCCPPHARMRRAPALPTSWWRAAPSDASAAYFSRSFSSDQMTRDMRAASARYLPWSALRSSTRSMRCNRHMAGPFKTLPRTGGRAPAPWLPQVLSARTHALASHPLISFSRFLRVFSATRTRSDCLVVAFSACGGRRAGHWQQRVGACLGCAERRGTGGGLQRAQARTGQQAASAAGQSLRSCAPHVRAHLEQHVALPLQVLQLAPPRLTLLDGGAAQRAQRPPHKGECRVECFCAAQLLQILFKLA